MGVNGLYRRRPGWRFTLPGLGCGPPGAGTVYVALSCLPGISNPLAPGPTVAMRLDSECRGGFGPRRSPHGVPDDRCARDCAACGGSSGPTRRVRHRPPLSPWVTSFIESSVVPGVGLSASSTFRGDVSARFLDEFRGAFDVTIRLRPCRGYWCLQWPRPTIVYGFAAPRFTARNFSARVPAAVTSR